MMAFPCPGDTTAGGDQIPNNKAENHQDRQAGRRDAGPRLYGRRHLANRLTKMLRAGQTHLLYGPVGSGKTSTVLTVERTIKKQRLPCGFCPSAQTLPEITLALQRAYPEVPFNQQTQRQIRKDLLDAIETRPGVLLLDHIGSISTHARGYLRLLRGTGIGVLLAADVESARDHGRLRAMHLAYQETRMPPLSSRCMHRVLAECLSRRSLPFALQQTDITALIRMARGRPGWIITASQILRDVQYWHNGHVLGSVLRAEIMTRTAGAYLSDFGKLPIRGQSRQSH